jgi:hypothetical protein
MFFSYLNVSFVVQIYSTTIYLYFYIFNIGRKTAEVKKMDEKTKVLLQEAKEKITKAHPNWNQNKVEWIAKRITLVVNY